MSRLLDPPYHKPPLLLLLQRPQYQGHPRHLPQDQDRHHLLVLVLQLEEEGHPLLLLQDPVLIQVIITAYGGMMRHSSFLQDKV